MAPVDSDCGCCNDTRQWTLIPAGNTGKILILYISKTINSISVIDIISKRCSKPLKTFEHLSWCRALSNYWMGYADLEYVYIVQKDAYRTVVNTNPGFWTFGLVQPLPQTACMMLGKSFPLVSLS